MLDGSTGLSRASFFVPFLLKAEPRERTTCMEFYVRYYVEIGPDAAVAKIAGKPIIGVAYQKRLSARERVDELLAQRSASNAQRAIGMPADTFCGR